MSDCSSGKCDVGVNLAREYRYVLKCSGCNSVYPLSKKLTCPKCGNLLYWYPKRWIEEGENSK